MLVGTVAIVLCMAVVLIMACVWRAIVAKKRRKEQLSAVGINSCIYDEAVGPVYEIINVTKQSASDERVSMTNNEAYESVLLKQTKLASLAVDVTNNEAYVTPFCRDIMSLERSEFCNTPIRLNYRVATTCSNCEDFESTQLVCCEKHLENFSESQHQLPLLNRCVNNTSASQKVDLNQGRPCSQNNSSMSLDESMDMVQKTANPKL